ncbi:FecR domain-containing protein [uncultured Chitinophaga sp.]|uniref:FecR domain-containing protein n=1 Tax=uncultured Chitinophaga sp. TaxID=339340 RepID=UPI00261032D9|nr:FecR domain-containing protein [uncultured Chitinophaga sp.]
MIDKYLKGELDAADAAKLEQWLDAMADETAFDALPAEEKQEAQTGGYQRLMQRIEQQQRPTPIRRLFTNIRTLRAAAAAACLIIAVFAFRNRLLDLVAPHRLTAMTSTPGKIKKHILSDGSIIWLKGNSKLTFPVTFGDGDRVVTLEGEALFEVAKDAAHPFKIHCGALTTQVLGTSFNIRSNGQETQVNVLTGKISLSAPQSGRVVLYPNQQALYTAKGTAIAKQEQRSAAVHELTRGTEYDMSFNDARLAEVIHRIERKFEVDIQTEEPAINSNLLTADLTDQSLKNTMEMISQALNLAFEIKGKTILLKQKKES